MTTYVRVSGARADVEKDGVFIPQGWGGAWRAARDNHAAQEVGVAIFGDSTTYASSTDPLTTHGVGVSWAYRMRALAIAAGYTDGGRGAIVEADLTAGVSLDLSSEGFPALVSATGTIISDGYAAGGVGTLVSNSNGAATRYQGKGTRVRLCYTRGDTYGGFTYSIDGGAAVTVEPAPVIGATGLYGAEVITISGLTEGTHTVDIVNLGGQKVNQPTTSTVGGFAPTASSGGSFAAGTYFYKVTAVTAAGETDAPVVNFSKALTLNQKLTFYIDSPLLVDTSFNVYRSTTSGGTYGLVANVAASGSAVTQFIDTGTAVSGTNPPGTNTAGRDSSRMKVGVYPEFVRATGLIFHKMATSGTASGDIFGTANPTIGNSVGLVALGLTPLNAGTALWGWMQPEAPHPAYRTIRLAIFSLGINDMQGMAGGTNTAAAARTACDSYLQSADNFVRMTRAAGADPLIVVPHLDNALGNHVYAGMYRETISAFGRSASCAVVDFMEALGPPNTRVARGLSNNVHANQLTYDTEGAFLWNEVLSK